MQAIPAAHQVAIQVPNLVGETTTGQRVEDFMSLDKRCTIKTSEGVEVSTRVSNGGWVEQWERVQDRGRRTFKDRTCCHGKGTEKEKA